MLIRAELRQRSPGEMVGLSFGLSADLFGPLFIVLMITNVPYVIAQSILMPDPTQPLADPMELLTMFGQVILVNSFLSLIFYPIMEVALVAVTAGAFQGRKVGVGEALGMGVKRYWGMLALLLALGLLQGVGFLALVAPMFVIAAMFYVAGPALVIERLGWLEALQRSRALTKDHLLETLVVLLATRWLIPFMVSPFVLLPAFALQDYPVASMILQYLITLIMTLMGLVAPVIVYYHLRVKKEAYDVEQLADLVPVIGARAALGDQ